MVNEVTNPRVGLSLRVPLAMYRELQAQSKERNLSLNETAIRVIESGLDNGDTTPDADMRASMAQATANAREDV